MVEGSFNSPKEMKEGATKLAKGIEADLDLYRSGDKNAGERASKTVGENVLSHKEVDPNQYIAAINETLDKDRYPHAEIKDNCIVFSSAMTPSDKAATVTENTGPKAGDSSHHSHLEKLYPSKNVESTNYPSEKVSPEDQKSGGDGQRHYARNEKGEIVGYEAPNGSTWVRDEKNAKLWHHVDENGKQLPDDNGKNTLKGSMHTLPDGTFIFANENTGKNAQGDDEKPHLTIVGPDGTRHDIKGDVANNPKEQEYANKAMAAFALSQYGDVVKHAGYWFGDPREHLGQLNQPLLEQALKNPDLSPEAKFAAAYMLAVVKKANSHVFGGGVAILPDSFLSDSSIQKAASEVTSEDIMAEMK